MRRTIVSAVAAAAVTASLFAATPANAATQPDVTGSGSSFANNFLQKCSLQYLAKTGNKVTYTSSGSGAGRKDFTAGKFDFAAADAPFADADKKPAGGVVNVPVIGGAVAIVFKVDGVKELNLDAAALSGIFGGTILKWNDAAIVALNPKAKLPDTAITVVYRESGGTVQNFQEYLYENGQTAWAPAASSTWKGAKGTKAPLSSDVAYLVKTTGNAIGFVDLSDVDAKVGKAAIKNAKGKFVKPTVAAASKMLSKQTVGESGAINIDFAKKVTGAYQISIATYLIIPAASGSAKGAAIREFATFAVENCSKKPAKGYSGFKGSNYGKALFFAKAGN